MKKFLVSLIILYTACTSARGQADDEIRPASLGISFFLNDFETARRIRTTSLSAVLRDNKWTKLNNQTPGLAVNYYQGLKKHIDVAATLAACFVNYPFPDKTFSDDGFLLEGDVSAHFKMTSERYILQPFLSLGVGAYRYRVYYGGFIPFGLGLKINLFNEADIIIQSQYRVPVNQANGAYHFYNSLGVAGVIGKKKIKEVAPPPPVPAVEPPKDSDGDGITDDKDKCPSVPGVAKYDGCPVPDTDKDGINDDNDKCPTVPGLAKYEGCPVPDTDKDGINDEDDKCPTVSGVARYEGCPVPDTDKDGVNDEEDKCPTVPGIASLQGCPEVSEEVTKTVKYAAQNVYFATASTKLLSKSFAPLDQVVKILKDNPALKLKIDGHTDNVGADDYNMNLSEGRAASVKNYMVSKGIDPERLESEGFGETKPIADNKTAAGRQQNRRVEMNVFY
ncbi:MAG: OmpA family protein [Chitinophagaceae bacterium]|nr:MAG: OmpA family protein [Chitinophagaceae bacterium]